MLDIQNQEHMENNKYVWIYGHFPDYGWGTMLCFRDDLKNIAFIPEGTDKVKVLDKKAYKKVK